MKGFVFGGLHDALLWKEGIFGISEKEEEEEATGWKCNFPNKVWNLAKMMHFSSTKIFFWRPHVISHILSIRNKRKKTSITDPQQDEIFHLLLLNPSFFALRPAVNRAQQPQPQTNDTRERSSVAPKSFSRYIQERGEEGFTEYAGFL